MEQEKANLRLGGATSWFKKKIPFIVSNRFFCSRNSDHSIFITSMVHEDYFQKIGQFPSVADLAENEIKGFKKILGSQYKDFNMAIGLFSHGVGAGSFVYLRRILENFIVKPAYEAAMTQEGWNNEEYLRSRFKDKLDLLKIHLPAFLVTNSQLYSIISKGIHDLSEDECKTNFPVLKECIKLILTDIENQKKHEARQSELSKALSGIASNI